MKTILILLITLTSSAFAELLPPINGPLLKKVFVDFKSAHYDIYIDLEQKRVYTKSKIELYQKEDGHIIFDLKKSFLKIKIDNELTRAKTFIIPSTLSLAKTVSKKTKKGNHTLEVETRLKKGISFKDGSELGFWIRDLLGRKFLEQYLPTNFEYDQYKTTMSIHFKGDFSPYEIMANGEITQTNDGVNINFPSFYTSSSYFLHIFKKDKYNMIRDTYKKLDGDVINFYVYSKDEKLTKELHEKAQKELVELENNFGAWPHDYLIVFGDDIKGGMEHAGATQTSLKSVGHELFHSYFSKTVIPQNGNAGWMDEGVVTWRDKGYPRLEEIKQKKQNLACHSIYRRSTDWDSYKVGGDVIAHIAYLFALKNLDLKVVLKDYLESYKYKIVTTKIFQNFLEASYGESLSSVFNPYVYKRKKCF